MPNEYVLTGYSLRHRFILKSPTSNENNGQFYYWLMQILGNPVAKDEASISISWLQSNDPTRLERLNKLMEFFPKIDQLHAIKKFLTSLMPTEAYAIFPVVITDAAIILKIFEVLKDLNGHASDEPLGARIKAAVARVDNLLLRISEYFEIILPEGKIETSKKQHCRICNLTKADGAKFSHVSHVIPFSLGNRKLISRNECNACNKRSGEKYEQDLLALLSIYIPFFRIEGRKGMPKRKFSKDQSIEIRDKAMVINYHVEDGKPFNPVTDKFELMTNEKVAFGNIYRALIKMAVLALPDEVAGNISGTCEWLNDFDGKSEWTKKNIPKLAFTILSGLDVPEPVLTCYVSKPLTVDLPYIFAELKVRTMCFAFIVPFTGKDSVDFSNQGAYDKFWQYYNTLRPGRVWSFFDCFHYTPVPIKFNISFEFQPPI